MTRQDWSHWRKRANDDDDDDDATAVLRFGRLCMPLGHVAQCCNDIRASVKLTVSRSLSKVNGQLKFTTNNRDKVIEIGLYRNKRSQNIRRFVC